MFNGLQSNNLATLPAERAPDANALDLPARHHYTGHTKIDGVEPWQNATPPDRSRREPPGATTLLRRLPQLQPRDPCLHTTASAPSARE